MLMHSNAIYNIQLAICNMAFEYCINKQINDISVLYSTNISGPKIALSNCTFL